jgi:2-polyprenyl-3-methyl-5-hydroxy-6-metoxy-1,4-benzoquinol methylase
MRSIVKALGAWPFAVIPARLRRRIVGLAVHAVSRRDPTVALRELLELERDLSGAIDLAGMRYEGGVHPKHRITRYHDFFVARVKPNERVLDIGSGIGAVAHSVAVRAGATVVGIDLDARNVEAARERFAHPRLTFVAGDATRDVPPGPFDVVIASNVIEHLEHRVEFYRAIESRVRPSRWLVRVPSIDRDWRVALRGELGLFAFSDPTHFTEYTRETFEREARAGGLEPVDVVLNWGEIWAELRRPS